MNKEVVEIASLDEECVKVDSEGSFYVGDNPFNDCIELAQDDGFLYFHEVADGQTGSPTYKVPIKLIPPLSEAVKKEFVEWKD